MAEASLNTQLMDACISLTHDQILDHRSNRIGRSLNIRLVSSCISLTHNQILEHRNNQPDP